MFLVKYANYIQKRRVQIYMFFFQSMLNSVNIFEEIFFCISKKLNTDTTTVTKKILVSVAIGNYKNIISLTSTSSKLILDNIGKCSRNYWKLNTLFDPKYLIRTPILKLSMVYDVGGKLRKKTLFFINKNNTRYETYSTDNLLWHSRISINFRTYVMNLKIFKSTSITSYLRINFENYYVLFGAIHNIINIAGRRSIFSQYNGRR